MSLKHSECVIGVATRVENANQQEWHVQQNSNWLWQHLQRKGPITLRPDTVVGIYWGNETRSSGIPSHYAPIDAPIPEGSRDGGAYLVRHRTYLVEVDEDCSMGYANEGWPDANSFFQHSADSIPEIMLVLKQTLPLYGLYELMINYWKE